MAKELTRAEMYEEQKRVVAEAEKKDKEKYSYTQHEHPEYCHIPKGKLIIMRPSRMNDPRNPIEGFDNRYFNYTFLTGDNGKKFPYFWGFESWADHPVYRIAKVVAKGSYDQDKKEMIYDNDGCELLAEIRKKGMDNGWKGNKKLLMNVEDRMDNWCVENKKTKVLAKAVWDSENERMNTDYGCPVSFYSEFVRSSEQKFSSINGLDFAVEKLKTPEQVGNQKLYYKIFLPEYAEPAFLEQFNKESGVDYSTMFSKAISPNKDLELWDFESMPIYKPSSVSYFVSRKKEYIGKVDEKYGTKFLQELTELADIEKGNSTAKQEEEIKKTYSGSDVSQTEKDTPSEPEQEAPKKRRAKKESSDPTAFDPMIYVGEAEGLLKLGEKELSLITAFDSGLFTFNVPEGKLDDCDTCKKAFPDDWGFCPYCAEEYED